MSEIFRPARAKFTSLNGDPLVRGKVSFFDAGTTDPREVWYNANMQSAGSSVRLDADGGVPATLNVGDGFYKYIVYSFIGRDTDGTELFKEVDVEDNIPGGDVSGLVNSTATITTVTGLRSLTAGAYNVVTCLGHTDADDGGGGIFQWNATLGYGDDNGAYITPLGSPAIGRWVRIFSDNTYDIKMWGVLPSQADVSGSLQYAITYCKDNYKKLTFSAGALQLNTAAVEIDCDAFIENDCSLNDAADVTFTGICQCMSEGFVSDNLVIQAPYDGYIKADWSGCIGDGVDHTAELNTCIGNLYGNKLLFSNGNYLIGAVDVPLSIVPTFINNATLTIDDTGSEIKLGEITNLTGSVVISGGFGTVELDNGSYNSNDFELVTVDDFNSLIGMLIRAEVTFKWIGEYTLPGNVNSINDTKVTHDVTNAVITFGDYYFQAVRFVTEGTYSFNITGSGMVLSSNYSYHVSEFVEDLEATAAIITPQFKGALNSTKVSVNKLVGDDSRDIKLDDGISLASVQSLELENLRIAFQGDYDFNIVGGAGSKIKINDCLFSSTGTSSVMTVSGADCLVDNCVFTQIVLRTESQSMFKVLNNYFNLSTLRIAYYGTDIYSTIAQNNKFIATTGYGGFVNIIGATSATLVKGVTVTNNWFEGYSGTSGTARIVSSGVFNVANGSHKASIKDNHLVAGSLDIMTATEGSIGISYYDTNNSWVNNATILRQSLAFAIEVDRMFAFSGNTDEEIPDYMRVDNMTALTYDSTPEVIEAYALTYGLRDRIISGGASTLYTMGKLKTDGVISGTRQPISNTSVSADTTTVTGTFSWSAYASQ